MIKKEQHKCNRIPDGCIVIWDEYDNEWQAGIDEYWQETGIRNFSYCPWCGLKLD